MKCPACFFNNRKGATECSSCGAAMLVRDRALQPIYDQSQDKRKHDDDMFTARHEQRRYGLSPQDPGETDEGFCNRINIEKTPHVLREHQRIIERNAPRIEREPGSDDA